MQRFSTALLGALSLAFPACSGEGESGATSPQGANVAGSWDYVAVPLSGEIGGLSIRCGVTLGTLNLNQQTGTVSGTLDGGALTCEVPSLVRETAQLGPKPIGNGLVTGTEIEFDYNAVFPHVGLWPLVESELGGAPVTVAAGSFHHEGTASGNSLSGTATVTIDIERSGARPLILVLTGPWMATR